MAKKEASAPKKTAKDKEGGASAAYFALRSEQATRELKLRETEHEWRKVERHAQMMAESVARTAMFTNVNVVVQALSYVVDPARKDNTLVTDLARGVSFMAKRFAKEAQSSHDRWQFREKNKGRPIPARGSFPADGKVTETVEPAEAVAPAEVKPVQQHARSHRRPQKDAAPLKQGLGEKLTAALAARGEQAPEVAAAEVGN
jgi:hypothetical protein